MAKYRVKFCGEFPDEDVDADLVEDGGHEGYWLDLYRTPVMGGKVLALRVPKSEVSQIRKL